MVTTNFAPGPHSASALVLTSPSLPCMPACQMLDTCMRNCHPMLHIQLASSPMWADILKLVTDTSVARVGVQDLCAHLCV